MCYQSKEAHNMRKSCTIPYQKSGSAAGFTVRSRSRFMNEDEYEHNLRSVVRQHIAVGATVQEGQRICGTAVTGNSTSRRPAIPLERRRKGNLRKIRRLLHRDARSDRARGFRKRLYTRCEDYHRSADQQLRHITN